MMNLALIIAAAVLGILSGIIAFAFDPAAGALFSVMWAFALSFIEPRRAWLWWLLLAAWAPLGALTGALPAQPNGAPWCPNGVAGAWQIAGVIILGTFAFAGAGALTGAVLDYALRSGPWRDVRWMHYVKPVLNWGGSAVAVLLVLYTAFAISAPLQPYGIGERYCWDEFCFRTMAVKRVKSVGDGPLHVKANGTFYIVTAQLEAPWWGRFWWSPAAVFVETRDGGRYTYSVPGQRAIDQLTAKSSSCHEILGAAETETIVFDLPDDALQPRLLVRDTLGFEGFIGSMRIGHPHVNPAFNLRYD